METVIFDGKTYELLEDAYLDGVPYYRGGETYYADAVELGQDKNDAENVIQIVWDFDENEINKEGDDCSGYAWEKPTRILRK